MGHNMGMNDTNQYKLPAIGQGKMGKHEFEWTIVEKWALVKFPGMLQEGMCDLEIECSLAPNGYFDMDAKTQTCWHVWEGTEAEVNDNYSDLLEEIRPFFDERYTK